LRKNINANYISNIEIQKIALGASSEMAELRTPKQKYGSSSILLLEKKESDTVELIEIVTADSFLKSRPELVPSFIKIDIEGYEPRMISGAHKLIADNLPIIMIEVSPKLWGKELTSDWEATLNFLIKVYGSGLICDGNVVSKLSALDFSKIGSRNRNFFFGLPS
jgi:FkbM family methyltransferase